MNDGDLQFNAEKQERNAGRLLPTAFLSLEEAEALAENVASRVRMCDPVHILTGFAFPNILLHPTDSHPALVEYLQHLILTHQPDDNPRAVTEDVVNELFSDVKNIFGSVSFARASKDTATGQNSELQDSLMMDSLMIRGKSYLIHQLNLLDLFLARLDDWLQPHMGFGADDLLRAAKCVFEAINEKANTAISEMQTVTKRPESGSFGLVVEHDIFSLSPPDEGVERVFQILSAAPGAHPAPSSILPGQVLLYWQGLIANLR